MPLIDFQTYRESSPATRNKWAAALGLQPMYSADVYGHSTPIKFVADKLKAKLGEKPGKKKKPKDQPQVDEGHAKKPDYSFDKLMNKAEKAAKDVNAEVEKGKDDEEKLDKEITAKKKGDPKADAKKPFPPKKAGEPSDKSDFDKDDLKSWEKTWTQLDGKEDDSDEEDEDK